MHAGKIWKLKYAYHQDGVVNMLDQGSYVNIERKSILFHMPPSLPISPVPLSNV